MQRRFLEIYRAGLARETRLFAGMESVLEATGGRADSLSASSPTNPPGSPIRCSSSWSCAPRFACVVSGDTVSERKPHPLPMLHAAKLAGVAAGECIYVGDAERDIQAAHAAGMPALVATYGYLQADEDWRAWGGDGFVERPADLLGWLERRMGP